MKREPLQNEDHFTQLIQFFQSEIDKYGSELMTNPKQFPDLGLVYYVLFSYTYKNMIAKYSAGYSINLIKSDYKEVIKYWDMYYRNSDDIKLQSTKEHYEVALWLLSLGGLLKMEDDTLDLLLKCVNVEGKDALFESLIIKICNLSSSPKSEQLIYPKYYKTIYDAILLKGDLASRNLELFLKKWYRNTNQCYWYESDKIGGQFFGYWCWEAALVTYLYDLDDRKYRDMPYYPKDMVDYARNNE